MQRKIINIQPFIFANGEVPGSQKLSIGLYALCNDCTLWQIIECQESWKQLPDIPQIPKVTNIIDLPFTIRTRNALLSNEYETLEKLFKDYSDMGEEVFRKQISRMHRMGKNTIEEIFNFLIKYGATIANADIKI